MQYEERLLDAGETAKVLGVSKALIRKKSRTGEIPCIRIGRAVRFDLTTVLEALKVQQEKRRNGSKEEW